MKVDEALQIIRDYYEISNPTEDDEFMLTEALGFLIEETKEPKYMCELAWYYCSKKHFELEIKYLKMAAEYGYLPAMEELGYMWYYGQHGEKNYKKAFYYFSKGAESGNDIDCLWCKYKLADMYHNGYYVEADEQKYREIIEDAYEKVKNPTHLNTPYPEILYRLAGIRVEDGKQKEAITLLKSAKRFMAERLSLEAFWGHIEVMGRIVRYLYKLTPFNKEKLDFYDLFYLEETAGTIRFKRDGKTYEIEITADDHAIGFEGNWYRNFSEFCEKAIIDDEKITKCYDELYGWEVV